MAQHALHPGKTVMDTFIRSSAPEPIGVVPKILNGVRNGVNPGNSRLQPMLNQSPTLQLPSHAIEDVFGIEPAWMTPKPF
ncbi:hypothetical protein [Arthrobacter sp. CAN_C5]|uniref:hypothetical protein n=1 Tax=Arthrobacter sp. CAN_C5 TaxID=2760706 RepID=UPI001FD9A474|nr:hypothetical protein [Arthrobacter sp. CAN_C5]MBP2218523.1 hypothetical protein [Arthrobacter sp. CAN_C5]